MSLRCTTVRPGASHRLICFPHAGGSPALYRDWSLHLPDFEVHAVCYPGRASRMADPLPTDLRSLAVEVAVEVERLSDRPLALFGHSLGASLALETARVLQTRGVSIAALFASGSGDGEITPLSPEYLIEDPDAVMDRLVSLGGTDRELAGNPDFRELILPYILADIRMFHAYALTPEPILRCPIITIVGASDADADRRPWRRLTCDRLFEHVVDGDHFYLIADPPFSLVSEAIVAASRRPDGIYMGK